MAPFNEHPSDASIEAGLDGISTKSKKNITEFEQIRQFGSTLTTSFCIGTDMEIVEEQRKKGLKGYVCVVLCY